MRVVVFGGRDFQDDVLANKTLDELHAIHRFSVVIDGMARGADTLGFKWAKSAGVLSERYPADWKRYGRAAGPIRNEQMIREGKPDMGVMFPGGTGTEHMRKAMKQAGIPVYSVRN